MDFDTENESKSVLVASNNSNIEIAVPRMTI